MLRTITIQNGNVLPLRLIPTGTIIHNVALDPEGRGILVRSAGTFAQVLAHEDAGRYTQIRLQSGEVRRVLQDCVATIGKVSNPLWKSRNLGKAGRSRWLGRRPHVRGMAMNRYVFLLPRSSIAVIVIDISTSDVTIPTEVVVGSRRVTSSPGLFGVG